MTETYMTIREMCDAFDVTPRTLRFYEAKELLFPERRGTKRLFTRRDRARLKLILRGKRFGFSLEDIRQLLDLYDPNKDNKEQMMRAYELGLQRLADLEARRTELEDIIADLKANLEWGAQFLSAPKAAAAG
ncbi:MAG: MerR family DNA-binding transcriptional regulator [Pseudomonadota bacterium]